MSRHEKDLEQLLDRALEGIRRDEPSLTGLLDILTDHRIADDEQLPDTGVPLDIERMLSSRFIRSPGYGTRACTVLTLDRNNRVSFIEQNFSAADHGGERVEESFVVASGISGPGN